MTDGKLKLSPEEIETIRTEILEPAKGKAPTDGEVRMFVHQCERTGLNPFDRLIYARFNWDKDANRHRMSVMSTIDGFRVVAERSGKYLGQDGPYWCGADGKWVDVWLKDEAPATARVGVWKQGNKNATYATARFKEYAQKTRTGTLTRMWVAMPSNQIAKCAEALALRRTFPNELSGIYTNDEMDQAENPVESTAQDLDTVRALPVATTEPVGTEHATAEVPSALDPPEKPGNGRDPNRKPIPAGTLPPERAPEPVQEKPPERDMNAPATEEELSALRDLIKAVGVSEPYIRMVLIEFGIEDVDTVENMLPKLTVGQALHVMGRVNERAGHPA